MPNLTLINLDRNDFGARGANALMRLNRRVHFSCNKCAAIRGAALDDLH